MSSSELVEYTFWGAKLLHSRSADLTLHYEIPLCFKEANFPENPGTRVVSSSKNREQQMAFETEEVKAITSIPQALRLQRLQTKEISLSDLTMLCSAARIPFPQILEIQPDQILLTAPAEIIKSLLIYLQTNQDFKVTECAIVTLIAKGTQSETLLKKIVHLLALSQISVERISIGATGIQIFIDCALAEKTVRALHDSLLGE